MLHDMNILWRLEAQMLLVMRQAPLREQTGGNSFNSSLAHQIVSFCQQGMAALPEAMS